LHSNYHKQDTPVDVKSAGVLLLLIAITVSSFSTEISRYFAPLFGLPLDDGIEYAILRKPQIGTSQHINYACVLSCWLNCCAAMSGAQPCQCGAAISVDRRIEITTLLKIVPPHVLSLNTRLCCLTLLPTARF